MLSSREAQNLRLEFDRLPAKRHANSLVSVATDITQVGGCWILHAGTLTAARAQGLRLCGEGLLLASRAGARLTCCTQLMLGAGGLEPAHGIFKLLRHNYHH